MPHVVLLGDSIFDNAAYVAGGLDVVRQLRQCLPRNWQASLRAVDAQKSASSSNEFHRMPATWSSASAAAMP